MRNTFQHFTSISAILALSLPIAAQNFKSSTNERVISRSAQNVLVKTDKDIIVAPNNIPLAKDETMPIISPKSTSMQHGKNKTDAVQKIMEEPPGARVGYTYYDFQTNGTIQRRLVYTPESDAPNAEKYVQMVWMASLDSSRTSAQSGQPGTPGLNDKRGGHYAVMNVSDPDNPVNDLNEWKKVDGTTRTGWPSAVRFQDVSKGIGYMAHAPVNYWNNGGFGNSPFSTFPGIAADGNTAWPRLASDGKDYLHTIYNTNTNADNSGTNNLAYRRSTDRGKTWSEEKYFTGSAAEGGQSQVGAGGDTYSIAANGSTVVAMYLDNSLIIAFRKSTDYGETWTGPFAVSNPTYTNLDTVDIAGSDSVAIHTDTVVSGGSQFDVIVDNEGKANFVYNEMLTYVVKKAVKKGSTLQAAGGTIYDMNDLSAYRDNNLGFRFWREGDDKIYLIAPPAGGNFSGDGEIVSRRRFSGLCRYPQLGLDADNKVYLSYCSPKSGDMTDIMIDNSNPRDGIADITVKGLFGHIYLTHADATRSVWSAPKNITPDGADCIFPSLCNDVANGRMYLAYVADRVPGDCVSNPETPLSQTGVYFLAYPTSQLNPLVGVQEQYNPIAGVDVSIQPNPMTNSASVILNASQSMNITISIHNSLGLIVEKKSIIIHEGNNYINLNTSDFAAGTYYYTLMNGKEITVKMFSVIR